MVVVVVVVVVIVVVVVVATAAALAVSLWQINNYGWYDMVTMRTMWQVFSMKLG
jgi:hypothetical protein